MPCPHYDLRIVGRSQKSRSVISSAAYQSGEKLRSELDNRNRNYPTRTERIVYTEIMLPENAPHEYADRETLWNSVEMNEKQSNAQYARRFVMALPRELSYEDNLDFVRLYCQQQFVSKGMCVDLAYHYDESDNPHVHILTTMRAIDVHGKWLPKCRKEYVLDEDGQRIRLPSGEWKSRRVNTTDWNDPVNLEKWRHEWEILQNAYLEQAGCPERIDMRSFERQENDLVPTVHLGPEASAMERRGIRTFLGDMNRDIAKHNALVTFVKKGFKNLYRWIDDLNAQHTTPERQMQRGVPIRQVLCDYLDQRMEERKDWHPRAQLKGTSKDMILLNEMLDWLDAHQIKYTPDLMIQLNTLEAASKAASETLQRNNSRRRTIAQIEDAADTIARLKPVVDGYSRIMLNGNKERYAAEHVDELRESKRAYAYLMKYHGGQLVVRWGEFSGELAQMKKTDADATAELERIKEKLTMLRKIKVVIAKVDPEIVGEKRSVLEALAQAQNRMNQTHVNREENARRRREQNRY